MTPTTFLFSPAIHIDGITLLAFVLGLFLGALCMLPGLKRQRRRVVLLRARVLQLMRERADAPREAFREKLRGVR